MQVDCAWCVASHDRQSPHFYALYAMHQFKPRPMAGVFLCTGSTVCRGRREEVRPGNRSRSWSGPCAGAASVSFARHMQEEVRSGNDREAEPPHPLKLNSIRAGCFLKIQPCVRVVKDIEVEFALTFRHECCDHGIAGNVNHGAGHIKQTVHTQYQGNALCG